MNIPYIDYFSLYDAYTLSDAAALLSITPDILWHKCLKYDILPDLNHTGIAVLSKHTLRAIHNKIYYECPDPTAMM